MVSTQWTWWSRGLGLRWRDDVIWTFSVCDGRQPGFTERQAPVKATSWLTTAYMYKFQTNNTVQVDQSGCMAGILVQFAVSCFCWGFTLGNVTPVGAIFLFVSVLGFKELEVQLLYPQTSCTCICMYTVQSLLIWTSLGSIHPECPD